MPASKNRIGLTVAVLLTFAVLIAALFILQHAHVNKKIDSSEFHGTLLQKPRGINQFSLAGTDNRPFTNASLQGQWTLLFFGFTNCGYVCPTAMAELSKMYRLLEEKKIKPLPRVVMISIDPDRDDLNKLANYVKSFHPHFYGAKGDDQVVRQMTREMGIAYTKVALPGSQEAKNYDVQHSAALILFNPQGELAAFFTTPHQADLLAADYQLLVS